MPKIAALYARVSTDKQRDEQTIASQIDEIRRRVAADGHALGEDCLFSDEGYTGELLARPALDRLRDAARQGRFQVLYVYDRGRLSRRFAYQELIIEELTDREIAFVTLHDAPAETPEDRILQAMQGVFHEYERLKIAERFRRGKLYRLQSGQVLGHTPKFGYRLVSRTKTRAAAFVIDAGQAAVVREMFRLVAEEGLSARQLGRRLLELGIPPPRGRAAGWKPGSIIQILRDEMYAGTHYYQRRESVLPTDPEVRARYRKSKKTGRRGRPREEWIGVRVPAIVSRELFERVQAQLERNRCFAPRNVKRPYLLRGLIYCPCGVRRGATQDYYRCNEFEKVYPLPRQCFVPRVNAALIDGLVWERLVELLSRPDLIQEHVERWQAQASHPQTLQPTEDATEVKAALAALQAEEERYALAFGQGVLPAETLKSVLASVQARRAALERQRRSRKVQKRDPLHQLPPRELAARVAAQLAQLNFSDREFVVRQLLDRVVATREQVTVYGFLPLPPPEAQLRQDPRYSVNTNDMLEVGQHEGLPFELALTVPRPHRGGRRSRQSIGGG